MTESIVIALFWLGLIVPGEYYEEGYQVYSDNAEQVNVVLEDEAVMSQANGFYYSNGYDQQSVEMIGDLDDIWYPIPTYPDSSDDIVKDRWRDDDPMDY